MKKQTLAELLRGPLCCAALWFSFAATQAGAQTTSPESTAPNPGSASEDAETEEDIVTLSPFVVEADEDADSYTAKYTLAGTRVRTDLRDTASAIQVVTAQFMSDIGATDSQSLLQYTTNTEVGGLLGNFSGTGGGFLYNENNNLLRPNTNTRVRGLTQADNTRDYFLSDIPWDGYIVDRVDLQRGPNSILFGVGSPAGIINTSINQAAFKNSGKFENRIDQFGSRRFTLDGNLVLVDDALAVRVAALNNEDKYRQRPAFQKDERYYGAIRFKSNLLGDGNSTDIRLNFETGEIDANRPRQMPPVDAITPWFISGGTSANPGLNKAYFNRATMDKGTAPYNSIPWLNNAAVGRQFWNGVVGVYGGNTPSAPVSIYQYLPGAHNGIGADGAIDKGIGGLPQGQAFAVASYHNYALHANSGIIGGANYSDRSLADPSIFDFYNNLIDGDNKHEWSDFDALTFGLSQTFWDNRLGADFSYFRQRYEDGQRVFLGNSDTFRIGIEMNSVLPDGSFNGGDIIHNATGGSGSDGIGDNVGRAYVASSDEQANFWNLRDRDSWRFTLTGELRGEDLFKNRTVADIFGKHVFTGLASRDTLKLANQTWAESALPVSWASSLGMAPALSAHFRSYDFVNYISPSLMGRSSAAGARLDRVRVKVQAPDSAVIRYFDSNWNRPTDPEAPGYVDPAAPYTYTAQNTGNTVTSSQAENPANYVGWVEQTVDFLNASEGDRAALTHTAGINRKVIDSKTLTWQGHLWNGNIVPVVGWRTDKVTSDGGVGELDDDGVISTDFVYNPEMHQSDEDDTLSYGLVVHMPQGIADKLPGRTRLSGFYNSSENFEAGAPRGDFFGNQIPNSRGETEDFGFVVSTLDDRLTVKATWYNTKLYNATLQGSTLGQNGYFLWAVPAWGTAFAANAAQGIAGNNDGNSWAWNYAASDDPEAPAFKVDGAMNPDWLSHPSTVALQNTLNAWREIPLEQSFFDAYGNEVALINVAALRAGDWAAADPIWAQKFDNQPIGGGLLAGFGSAPVMTVTSESKGIELELGAQITKNWNLTFNFSKTKGVRSQLAPEMVRLIEDMTEFLDGPAGDLRLWGSASNPMRNEWRNNVANPYQVLLAQEGSAAPELAPYNFRLVTNYSFQSDGFLKGSWIGGGFRWEDKRVLGYKYSEEIGNLDISKPWKSSTDQHFDLWLGRSQKVSDKINWRIQFNIRNLGESKGLNPVTINPDGTTGYSRITEGMVWQLTNTLEF